MSFNMTFIVQIIVFLIFVAICMKWIWPPIANAISTRQKEIEDSLNSAREAKQKVELSITEASRVVEEAKVQAQSIVDNANRTKAQIIDKATADAKLEKERIIKTAQAEIVAERNKVKEELRKEVSDLAVASAKKIIQDKMNPKAKSAFVDSFIKNL